MAALAVPGRLDLSWFPDWRGETVVCVANGPSLTREDCELVEGSDWPVIGVNDAYRICRLDLLYAADLKWWRHHLLPAQQACALLVTQFKVYGDQAQVVAEAQRYGLRLLALDEEPNLSSEPGLIHSGWNSGYQAINIAYLAGAARILLLGYDCSDARGKHWFGLHPPGLQVQSDYEMWRQAFATIDVPVPIINCSRETAIECFPRQTLEAALASAPDVRRF